MNASTVREAALAAYAAGLCPVPPEQNGSKRPFGAWKAYQVTRPTLAVVKAWYSNGHRTGLGIITGAVSGNAVLFEFEGRAVAEGVWNAFLQRAEETGLGDLLRRMMAGYLDRSPSDGRRFIYRCDAIEGNTRLAQRPATPEELAADSADKFRVLIETRGEGGYAIVPPSNGTVHPSGGAWVLESGGFATIPTLTPDEREALWSLARSFDQRPRASEPVGSGGPARPAGAEPRPGDDFAAKTPWADILEPHGWRRLFTAADGNQHWRRPGKLIGTSATISDRGEGVFYVFSTSTAFEPERAYTKFGAYAVLNHAGDFRAAARQLGREGFGSNGTSGTGAAMPPHADAGPRGDRMTLAEVEAIFGLWLASRDPVPLRAVLGTYAANQLDGDPVWLILVGGSGRGKTEMADSLRGRPDVRSVSSISHESALLSATPKKDAAKDASGGLLKQIGERGVLVIKDFTTILSMHRDARAGVLAALREVYDGHWSRTVGAEGGRTLTWQGHLGVIAGCTAAIDRAHAVTATMGERFLTVRVPDGDGDALARKALGQVGREKAMREQLAGAVASLFSNGLPAEPHRIDDQVTDRLVALVTLVTKARSPVERDYQGEIDLVLDSEGPTRIVKELAQLYAGLGAIGLGAAESWDVVLRAGLDSIPKLRGAVLAYLLDAGQQTTADARAVSHPTRTAVRALQDLEAHGVVLRVIGGQGRPDNWHVAEWAVTAHARAQGAPDLSEEVSYGSQSSPDLSEETSYEDPEGPSSHPLNFTLHVTDDKTGKVRSGPPCPTCGTPDWWRDRPDLGGVVCTNCHPGAQPGGQPTHDPAEF